MNSYIQHLGLTAWRKKTSLLVGGCLLILLIFGLQLSHNEIDKASTFRDAESPQAVAAGLSASVKFLNTFKKSLLASIKPQTTLNDRVDESNRVEMIARRGNFDDQIEHEIEKQLGIPFVNLDRKKPYIPKQRIVHFDLKGAPPKVEFFKKIFPMIRTMGATGILLEYEDMFPYTGLLKTISAKNAYSFDEINRILAYAAESKLDVIPLIQTFGHMEFALKHPEWTVLREVPDSPQALCPSRNSSLLFIKEMVKQMMAMHPDAHYLHIGCDEVFQMGECEQCRLELHETLFLRHVKNVASLVHALWPRLKLIIWDDMLRHLSQQSMQDMNLGAMVEPMVWVYAEDIYRFVQSPVWDKYAAVFQTAWTASAFKGAFGETLFVPDARRHLENNLRWLDVMSQQGPLFKNGLAGIALTGWQRYDHFAVLCELLPTAVPSLALSLMAVTHGFFNSTLRAPLLSVLSCPEHGSASRPAPFITLETDAHLWDRLSRCMFPGSPVFRMTYRLHSMEMEVLDYLKVTRHNKGWLTAYNVAHNYSLPLRVDELTADLSRVYHGLLSLVRAASDAMNGIYDYYTVSEWIEQRIYPYIVELEKIQNQSAVLKSVRNWPVRPLPPLKDLQRLGVPLPEQ